MTWEETGRPDVATRGSAPPEAPEAPRRRSAWLRFGPLGALLLVLAAMTGVRLALLGAPLSPDEAGFLRMGAQWSPGRSLYGDYWVSRPPGITAIYSVAAHLGGGTALRIIGIVAAVSSVLLAAAVTRFLTAGRAWPAVWVAAFTGALLSTPNLDVNVVDGEVLALPFLMGGVLGALRATVGDPSRQARVRWALCAGACGAAALSVKQNLLDVAVLVGGLVLVLALRRAWRPARDVVLGALAGAVAVVVPLLLLALQRGTSLSDLWDAVVMYRFRAAEVLARPSDAKTRRWEELVEAFTSSRAPWVLALLPTLLVPHRVWRWVRRRAGRPSPTAPAQRVRGTIRPDDPALAWIAAALVLWEAFSVKGGGGFWLHYLVGTVPGLTLVLALSVARLHPSAGWWRWVPRAVVVGGVVAATWSFTVPFLQDPPERSEDEAAVAAYLKENSHLGRTAVVAFGRATILEEAGMDSPYPQLWSVPVLTDDPELQKLTPVLAQQRATWVVTREDRLDAWGLDDTTAMEVLRRNYQRVSRSGDLVVWRAQTAHPAVAGALARPAGRPVP